jgi:hypothetical protein
MSRFGVLAMGLILLAGLGVTATQAATKPPAHLKLVGDHWTAWDPPAPGPEAYIIQKGDTLWDLAGKWFNDPFLWPQIWDQNRYILDSHWIYPGDPLVVPGRPTVVPDGGPPAVTEPEQVPPDSGDRTGIPPTPVVPALPPLQPVATQTDLYCSGLITQDEKAPGMWIAGRDTEREILGEGDVIFLNQGANHGVRAGDSLAIRRWSGPVVHPGTGDVLGTLVRRMGRARVLLAHENTSTAVIEMSCEDILEGDELVPWEAIPMPMLSSLPPFDRLDPTASGGPVGRVVYARDNLSAVGQGNVIFTDLGQHTGVAPGDVLVLFRERGEGLPRMMLGQAVVLTVEPETSTAKIVTSARESWIGDWVEAAR